MKSGIQKILSLFGYRLTKIANSSRDPFALQIDIVEGREPIIFDIGAHIGETAKMYRVGFPFASIY